jgi:hypothetical protein
VKISDLVAALRQAIAAIGPAPKKVKLMVLQNPIGHERQDQK